MAKQILVCEDESNILISISFIIKKEGFELLTPKLSDFSASKKNIANNPLIINNS